MPHLWHLIPDPNIVLSLEPEDLAWPLLEVLNSRIDEELKRPSGWGPRINLHNFLGEFTHPGSGYGGQAGSPLVAAVQEAWAYLLREGLVALDHASANTGTYFVTKRGRNIREKRAFDAYRTAAQLPRELLHPKLQGQPYLSFIRGDWPTAVFQAFKEVEINVRDAAGLTASDIGTKLMSRAFNPNGGELTDPRQEDGERAALMQLFVGAIGSYKNPHSHRNPTLDDAAEVIEMLLLASHLLRIVDARRAILGGSP